MRRYTLEELKEMKNRRFRSSRERNRKTEYNGRMYDSKLQASHAAKLDEMKKNGEIEFWIPEPSFPLPGGVRVKPDFMVIHQIMDDGSFIATIVDSKAYDRKTGKPRVSQVAKNKYKQFKELYGLEVQIWTSESVCWLDSI